MAALGNDVGFLLGGFHALGDDLHAQALAQLDDGANDGRIIVIVEQVLDATRAHRVPDHAPTRAVRVLENAAHVDAIITASSGLMPIGLQTSSEVRIASDTLRPLASVVRSARLAAISAILYSAWRR